MAAEADNLDRAADLTRARTDTQIAAVRSLAAPEQIQNSDGTWPETECVVCGVDLGKRAELGKIRCVHCQGQIEARGARWPR
jgi:hypothetical protein